MRTIRIPEARAPQRIIAARSARSGDAYPCVVCGIPVTRPRFVCHVIDGGGVALHPEDEALYVPDGGDMCSQPVGTDCLRRHPELKPYASRA